MKILLPTDFSKTAEKALNYAIDSFNRKDSVFILYHTFMPLQSGLYSDLKCKEENLLEQNKIQDMLREKAEKLLVINKNLRINIYVDTGNEERRILKYAELIKADLIVMGTTGASGLKAKLIGSITSVVMTKSNCPVIGVPEKYKPKALNRIAYCSNYRLEDVRALKYIINLVQTLNFEIQIWHFDESKNKKNANDKIREDLQEVLAKMFSKNKITYHLTVTANLHAALEKLSAKKSVDMIAMTTYPRSNFFQNLVNASLTKRVAYHTKIPLLTIPAT